MSKRLLALSVLSVSAISVTTVLLAPATVAAPSTNPSEISTIGGLDAGELAVTLTAAPSRPDAPRPTGRAGSDALPPDHPWWNLQLNLCNNGHAGCYEGGQSIPEAVGVIGEWYPDVVTVNEVCRSDVDNVLFPAMSNTWSMDWTFAVFMPAWSVNRQTGQPIGPIQCTGGRGDYGNAVMGHVFAEDYAGVNGYGGIYSWQATGTGEWRSWACGAALANYVACSTHLSSDNGTAAMAQCNELMGTRVPWVWSQIGGYRSTVVGGDFNLKYGGSPNIQTCVPSGWYRKGDGDVQHWFVRNEFAFDFTREIGLDHTDHPGWLVATIT